MGLADINVDVGSAFSGLGQLAKDLRTAFTGKEPIDSNKAADLAFKVQELETGIERTRLSIMVAEASSLDPLTSRARPFFLYVFYLILIILIIVAPLLGIFFPAHMNTFYVNVKLGFDAIPDALWAAFVTGYLGYVAARQYGKTKGTDK